MYNNLVAERHLHSWWSGHYCRLHNAMPELFLLMISCSITDASCLREVKRFNRSIRLFIAGISFHAPHFFSESCYTSNFHGKYEGYVN